MDKAEQTLEELNEILIDGFKKEEFSIEFAEKISKVTEEFYRYKEMDKLISEIQEKIKKSREKLAGVYLVNDIPNLEITLKILEDVQAYLAELKNYNSGIENCEE